MRVSKRYAGSLLVSAFILVATSYSQTEQKPPTAADPAPAEAQTTGTTQISGSNDAPSGCSYKLPFTKDGDIKDGFQPGPPAPPTVGIPAVPVCPMPPVEFHPVNSPSEPMPDGVLYEIFFNNMAVLDQVAEREDQTGKHEEAMAWRTHDQRQAGLNDAEGEILRETEADCMRIVHEQDTKIKVAVRKFRLATGGDIRAPIPPELFQMNDERYAIIQRHIDQLKVALGASSFQKLDRYVHAVFAPHEPASQAPTSASQPASR